MKREERLERIRELPREEHHHELHDTHQAEGIDRGTLFYVKEYGSEALVWRTILRESLPVLILASLVSSVGGGVALEHMKETIFALTPFLVLLPALNDMIGDFGIVVSSRISELLYQKEALSAWWRDPDIHRLFFQVIAAAAITATGTAVAAIGITTIWLEFPGILFAVKVVSVVLLNTLVLTATMFVIAVISGIAVYHRGRDPNNFLIPITTSLADVLNILLLTGLIVIAF